MNVAHSPASTPRAAVDEPALRERLKANGPPAAQRYDRVTLAARMLELLRNGVGPR